MANKLVVQRHHIMYENKEHHQPEVVVKVYKGEHFLITSLQRRKNISKGFITQLKVWLALNEGNAKEL